LGKYTPPLSSSAPTEEARSIGTVSLRAALVVAGLAVLLVRAVTFAADGAQQQLAAKYAPVESSPSALVLAPAQITPIG
jgi:hypothetical protein